MAMTDLPVGMRGLHCPFRPVRRPIQKLQCLRNKDVESDANGVVGSSAGLPADGDAHRSALAIVALWSNQSLAQLAPPLSNTELSKGRPKIRSLAW